MAVRDWSDQFKSVPAPSGGFYGGAGYKNPLGDSAPSWSGDNYDWGKNSKGIDWNSGFDVDRTGMFEKLFEKSKQTDKYRSRAENQTDYGSSSSSKVSFGDAIGGSVFPVTDSVTAVVAPQHAPVHMQGVQGSPGILSQVAGIAAPVVGLMGGPTAPFIAAGLGGISRTGW